MTRNNSARRAPGPARIVRGVTTRTMPARRATVPTTGLLDTFRGIGIIPRYSAVLTLGIVFLTLGIKVL